MTQALTVQEPGTAAQMAAALELVDVVNVGADRMEAVHRQTRQLLGTAICSRHPQSDWLGWLVEVRPYYHEVIIATGVAELVLLCLAASGLDSDR